MASELTEWRPFSGFAELRHRFDQLFRDLGNGHEGGWSPSVDVIKHDDTLIMRVDIPGVKPDEVEIDVEGDVLTIFGEHREEHEEGEGRFVRRERRYGSFSRSMVLPKGINADDIDARSEDGVLEVTIPLPEEAEKRRIEVKPKPGSA